MFNSDFLGMLSPEFLGCLALVVKGSVHIKPEIDQEATCPCHLTRVKMDQKRHINPQQTWKASG